MIGSGSERDEDYLSASSDEERSVRREMIIHGQRFNAIFDGYFSDPEVARPLVEAVERAINSTHPSVVADLGGGTCFILRELLRRGLQGIRLVNVDISPKQLAICEDDRIVVLQTSLDRVTRHDLQAEDGKLLLIARAVLHYFGRSGIGPLLKHLRSQIRPGELFIHQSGCFQREEDADLINHLYARMDAQKWFFTVDELRSRLEDAGFIVREILTAPGLEMSSEDLGERYGLSHEQRSSIAQEVLQLYGQNPEIFVGYGDEFKAYLHTSIFVCEAV